MMRDAREGSEERDDRDDRDGTDWLLGELAEAEEASASPAAPAPEPDEPVTPVPGWTQRAQQPGGDWFSLAEPKPLAEAAPTLPMATEAAVPPPVSSSAPGDAEGVPRGPVTPAAPFALTWGGSDTDVVPPTRFAPPRTARQSFTPPSGDTPSTSEPHASTPDAVAGAGAGENANAPVDDFGAAVWSALTESEDSPRSPEGTITPGAEAAPASVPRTRPPFPAFASDTRAEAAAPAPAAEHVDDLFAAIRADAEEASQAEQPAVTTTAFEGPVDRPLVTAEPLATRAQPEPDPEPSTLSSSAAPRSEPHLVSERPPGSADGAGADETDADGDSSPTFAWNLTPDPTAADPRLTPAGAASETPVTAAPADAANVAAGAGDPASGGGLGGPGDRGGSSAAPGPSTSAAADAGTSADPGRTSTSQQQSLPLPAAGAVGRSISGMPSSAQRAAGPAGPVRGGAPSAASGGGGGGRPPAPASGRPPRSIRTLIWVAGGLVLAIVLAGLYFLGTQLGGGDGAAPAPAPAPASSAAPTPTPTPEPVAPQPAGVHAWNTLFGGECLDPFTDPWAEEFTVVDCAAPHAAQLVLRGELTGDAAAPFPGEAELGAQMNALCTAPGVIDVAAAAGIADLQVQGTYPADETQWADGERTYYCFLTRAGGESLTGSLQGPGPAA